MACTVFVTTTLLGGHTRMPELKQYSVVCVRQLLHQPEHYNGWRVNQRAPQVGDKGTIVDILRAPGIPVNYVVECSSPTPFRNPPTISAMGRTICTAGFPSAAIASSCFRSEEHTSELQSLRHLVCL